MDGDGLKTWMIGSLLPLILGLVPVYIWWMKQRLLGKKQKSEKEVFESKLNIENFNSILAANKLLRDELDGDKKELKEENNALRKELQVEKSVIGEMAKDIVLNSNRIDEVSLQNKALFRHLKIILGMRTIIDVSAIKIFVLEDNEDDATLIEKLLIKHSIHNVTFFRDPDSFYESIDPDVRILIIDHKLEGGITGLDVVKKIIDINDYRYFIMLSGMEDFDIIYKFNRLVNHGIYILKGKSDSDELVIKSIKNTLYYLRLLSDTYSELNTPID